MHSVELVLDPAADEAVRDQWTLLAEAGLPSQALHRSPSNRPHVTVTTSEGWPEGPALAAALGSLAVLPLPVRLGPPVLLGRGPYVLARLVVATEDLLRLHADLARALAPLSSDLVAAGRWLPHVTLARRLRADQLEAALDVVGPGPDDVVLEAARHWDSVARVDEPLTPPRHHAGGRSVGG
ncbi:2'-5' RNA ligase family protein [Phycicoccus sonneratiae]|uniref:2'-5' RNA ligase family protein n=1 Tax=Phycicoccus sonneratiae TaxID=2807628 RepID=A0ABS2CMM5_9MICO|nr:2'-5' RNA ligase family protein [Phycicoccus sonneraticus]MBM6401132.1 2'-5' RNA ligase family protein [Phycicoccus sonneraticus]